MQTKKAHIARSIAHTLYGIERRMAAVLMVAILLCSALYVYFVASAVTKTVALKETQSHMTTLRSHISEFETQYLTRTETLTQQHAVAVGLAAVPSKSFAKRAIVVGRAQ